MHIGRVWGGVRFPAEFMLIAAMNPCPCGFLGSGNGRCICHPGQILRYRARVSGPLLDRVDLHVEVPRVESATLLADARGERSEAIRIRVEAARERQRARLGSSGRWCNARMSAADVRTHCAIDARAESLLRAAMRHLDLSARGFHRILRVARTIADLAGCERLLVDHVGEAIQYRSLDAPSRHAAGEPV